MLGGQAGALGALVSGCKDGSGRRRILGLAVVGLLLAAVVGWGGCVGVDYPAGGVAPAALPVTPQAAKVAPIPTRAAAPQTLHQGKRGVAPIPTRAAAAAIPEITPQVVESSPVSVDRIAYIGPYGDLFTVKADGTEVRRLTGVGAAADAGGGPAGSYLAQPLDLSESWAWPTWSPDGTRLAVSRVQVTDSRSLRVSVYILDAQGVRSRMVYENDTPAFIADGAPHYLYWSPDGEYLSFLAATRQGLTLFIVNPDTAQGAIALERGAPLYYSWGGDGQSLLLHSRAAVKLLRPPFAADTAYRLVDAAGFRTPALSPDGRLWAVAVSGNRGGTLYLGERDNPAAAPQAVLSVGPAAAFMWSPDGQRLAVADQPDAGGGVFERLQMATAEGKVQTLAAEPLLAFYWSPDGQRLAWVALDAAEQVFVWKVAAIEELAGAAGPAAGRELLRFRPSGEVFTMLSFFDQYAYSHSPWSPDGTRLVTAGRTGPVAERRNGDAAAGARIYVLDAVGEEPPREIAQGGMAVWSWN